MRRRSDRCSTRCSARAAAEVTAVAYGVGPGPFTGLRVGMAAARTAALVLGVPELPVLSHDAIALAAVAGGAALPLVVVADAKRREVYSTVYRGVDAAGLPRRDGEPQVGSPDALPDLPRGVRPRRRRADRPDRGPPPRRGDGSGALRRPLPPQPRRDPQPAEAGRLVIALRPVGTGDLDPIMAIETASFPTDAWSAAMMRTTLADPDAVGVVAVDGDDGRRLRRAARAAGRGRRRRAHDRRGRARARTGCRPRRCSRG